MKTLSSLVVILAFAALPATAQTTSERELLKVEND